VKSLITEYKAKRLVQDLVAAHQERMTCLENGDWISAEWAFENESMIINKMREFLGLEPLEL
jgi:hypothetical protein